MKSYFIYITTNPDKQVLYIGITNNLKRRLSEHYKNKGKVGSFAGEYYCYKLIYWERFPKAKDAIARETQLKNWSRIKKGEINRHNEPRLEFFEL